MASPKRIKEAKALLENKANLISFAKPGLESAIASYNKKYGEHSLSWLSSKSKDSNDGWSTDLFGLDYVLGRKGPIRGRIMEIAGLESSGKTTIALWLAASVQRKGGLVLYIDQEHTLDPTWAARNGVDLESMLIAQPQSGEEALFLCELMSENGLVDLIIVDSVPSLLPKEVLEKDPGDAFVAAIPRLLNPSVSRINNFTTMSGTNVVFINQMRDIIDRSGFGGPKRMTPGGAGLKFYSSYRLEMIRIASIKSKAGGNIGNEVKVRSIKNKCSSPFREEVFEIMFWEDEGIWGIWPASDIYNICTQIHLIDPKQRSKKFIPDNTLLGDGEVNAKLAIHQDENIRNKITFHIKKIMGYEKQFCFNEQLVGKLNQVVTNKLALDLGVEEALADIDETKGEDESKQAIPEIDPSISVNQEEEIKKLLKMLGETNKTEAEASLAPASIPQVAIPKMPTFASANFVPHFGIKAKNQEDQEEPEVSQGCIDTEIFSEPKEEISAINNL